jgi:hypothetical protein
MKLSNWWCSLADFKDDASQLLKGKKNTKIQLKYIHKKQKTTQK